MPKQFVKIAGKCIIEHTLEKFQAHELIDEICVVAKEGFEEEISRIVLEGAFGKVKKIIIGGSERKDSSEAAISALSTKDYSDECNVIFHDAVRPFVTARIIGECLSHLNHYNAVDVAIPATDTIIEVDDGYITAIPDRSRLMQGQTPQGFKLKTIREAYRLANLDENFKVSCDCGVVKKFLPNEKIGVVLGHSSNIKITNAEDIFLADKLFQLASENKNYLRNDDYYAQGLKSKVVVIFGGSYGIGEEIAKKCEGFGAKIYSLSRSVTGTHVESMSDVESALSSINDQEGRIDFVINCAGLLSKQPLNHMSQREILELINVNYVGTVNVAKAAFPYLKESRGQLVLFTSSSYTRGRANYAIYSSSKSAIVNLSQALAEEWTVDGIRVNCVNPQRTKTPMRTRNFGAEPEESLLKASDVASATINVLLEQFTGQVIDVKLK